MLTIICISFIVSLFTTLIGSITTIYVKSMGDRLLTARNYYLSMKRDLGANFKYSEFVTKLMKTGIYMERPAQFNIILPQQEIIEKYFNKKRHGLPMKEYRKILKEIENKGFKLGNILNADNKFIINKIIEYALQKRITTFNTKTTTAIYMILMAHHSFDNYYTIAEFVRAIKAEFPNFVFRDERAHYNQKKEWEEVIRKGQKNETTALMIMKSDKQLYTDIENFMFSE